MKDRLCEDTEIARLMKERGSRVRVSWGSDLAAVRMYSSLKGIIKGWSRIYYAAKVGNPRHILFALAFILFNCYSVYPALVYGVVRLIHPQGNLLDKLWLPSAMIHWLALSFILSRIYYWSKNSAGYALAFPLAGLLLIYTLLKALMMCFTKRVEWRGTRYSHTMTHIAVKP